MDNRLVALKEWLGTILKQADFEVRPASVDASFRRYFRVFTTGQTFIAVDAPPAKEDAQRFVDIAERLGALGLNVPRILQQDIAAGFLLVTDLGERLYLHHLNEATAERLYGDALGALVVLQAGVYRDPVCLPDYDERILLREMELFRDWYLQRHLGITPSAHQRGIIDRTYAVLIESALAQPRVWVHRDYHSRNLMVSDTNNPGILDFQDAVRGPVTYDLVSLLRDCYIAWPRARVEEWVKGYHALAQQSGIPVCDDEELFLKWFDLMGVQRHLKASGIFARLYHRDNKPNYLADIPRTLNYVSEVSDRYREMHQFFELLSVWGIPRPETRAAVPERAPG